MEKAASTNERILKIASDIFYKKGLAGARMQEIADQAGINKAMLHYYFKSKEQLFTHVFEQAFHSFISHIADVLNSNDPLHVKLSNYVDHTIDSLKLNPGIIVFVMYELNVNPARITELFAGKGNIDLKIFKQQVATQSAGAVDPEMLFTDMVALCIYPFIAKPILKKIMKKNDQSYLKFVDNRKDWIKKILLARL